MSHQHAYESFAAEALRPAPPAPEPLTTKERRQLSATAFEARRTSETDYLCSLYVPTPQQIGCARLIRRYLRIAQAKRNGAQDCLYLLGQPGTGKSTAVRRAAFDIYREAVNARGSTNHGDATLIHTDGVAAHVPVVWITVRSDAGKKPVPQQLVWYSGYPSDGSRWDLTNLVIDLAPRHGWLLVVLDDVHNLATGGSSKSHLDD